MEAESNRGKESAVFPRNLNFFVVVVGLARKCAREAEPQRLIDVIDVDNHQIHIKGSKRPA
jgi:hypothetical protein